MTLTRARTIQYIGILCSLLIIAVGYWYWSVRAGVKSNTSASQPQGTGRLDSGLVGYWKLDETTGSAAADASTNSNNGTLVNMENGDWTTGQIGNGLDFDGSNEQITVPGANPIDIRSSMTLSTWAKFDTLPGNGESRGIFRKTADSGANHLYTLRFTNLGSPTYHLLFTPGGGGAFNYSDAFAATTGTWYLLTLTYDAGTDVITYYFNGVPVGTDTDTVVGGYASGTGDLYIGSTGGSEYFDGQLDEMRIYDRVLSPDEVSELQRLTSPTSVDTSLKGYWSFDGQDISGTTAYDRSGAGNNGTLTNSPTITQGSVGQALNFSGSYVDVGSNSSIDALQVPMTISGWFKETSSGATRSVLGQYSGVTAHRLIKMVRVDSGVLKYYASKADGTYQSFGTFTPSLNEWHYFAVTVTGSIASPTVTITLDSASETSALSALSSTPDTSVLTYIGSNQSGAEGFVGAIDEVRIYNRVLAASEIKSLYDIAKPDATNSASSQAQGTGRLDSGLAGYWKLDENTGTTASDSSTNGNNGTLTSGPTWTTGQIGSAVDFDGTDDYINIGTPTVLDFGSGPHTISAWAKTDIANTDQVIFSSGTADCCGSEATLGFDYNLGGGFYEFQFNHSGASLLNSNIPGDIQTGTWYHVVGTWDGVSTRRIYVNGVLSASDTVTSLSAEFNNNVLIGRGDTTFPQHMNGQIDEVRVYNRGLSADEVGELYRLTSPTSVDTSLKGYWSFNGQDMNATTAFDQSGAGNNGTLTGGPTTSKGIVGQGLLLDGVNDVVQLLSDAPNITGALTASFWMKTTATSQKTILGFWQTTGWTVQLDGDGSAPGKLSFYSNNSGFKHASTAVNDGAWHHVAFTLTSGGVLTMYRDGVVDGSYTSVPLPGSYTDDKFFSSIPGGGGYFPGTLDEVRIYNRALTAAEIQGQYDSAKPDKTNSSVSTPQGTGRLDSGLAGYWKLDENTGTSAADTSTNSNTGTLVSGPTWTTGRIGSAATFDGTDDYISTALTSLYQFGNQSFSVAGWFKRTSSSTGYILTQSSCSGGWGVLMTGGTFSAQIRGAGSCGTAPAQRSSSSTGLNDDSWHHFVVTFTTSTTVAATNDILIYIDGSPNQGSVTKDGTVHVESTGNISIAAREIADTPFAGSLDEMRIYNRPLSADEVSQLYRLGTPTGTDTSLKGYWSFNGQDMTATTAFDRSGSAINGTLAGNARAVRGKLGQALSLDGTGDYVNLGNTLELGLPMTVSGWINLSAYPASAGGILTTDKTNPGDHLHTGMWFQVASNGVLGVNYGDNTNCNGGGRRSYVGTKVLALNTWYHVTAIVSGPTDMKLYIDGAEDTGTYDGSGGTITYAAYSAAIGRVTDCPGGAGLDFPGKIDEVRIYNRALSATEVQTMYKQNK